MENIQFVSIIMKKNTSQIFETLVFGSANKLKEFYSANNKEELHRLNEALKSEKSMKELDANKFFYIYELMFETKNIQLVDEALRCIHDLIAQKFLNPSKDRILQQSLLRMLRKVLNRTPEIVANILVQIQSPRMELLSLLFQVYPLCVYEVTSQRVRTAGINIIARVFSFKRKEVSIFTLRIYKLFRPSISVLPDQELTTGQEQQNLLKSYISRVLSEVVTKVELSLDSGSIQKGKFGLCFMCRSPAQFYCKDTRVSVCSPDCKKKHFQELNKVIWLTALHSETEKKEFEMLLFQILNEPSKQVASRILSAVYLIEIILSSQYILTGSISLIQQTSLNIFTELKKLYCLLLYLSAQQKGQLIEHIFLDLLLFSQQMSQYRIYCQSYLKQVFDSERVFEVYYNYDMNPKKINLVRDCLSLLWQRDLGKLYIECLINNVFAHNNQQMDNSPYGWIANDSEIVSIFNNNIQNGYELFLSKYNGSNIERDLAFFFRKNEKTLNRQKLGQFFAKNEDLNKKVLELFLEQLNLNTLQIDEAIREVFYHFSVGQSQQIFRVIQILTKIYTNKKFESSDEIFQFSYFILMLQTELHNPAIEKRTTFQEMVGRVAAFNKRIAQNIEYLSYIYNNIKSKPFSQTQKKPRYRDFQIVHKAPLVPYSKSILLYHNWNTIYSVLSGDITFRKMELIYRTSFALIHYDITHIFVDLLLRQLPKVDFLTKDLSDQQAFLISSVFTLIWHEPNHILKQWRKILVLLAQYEVLLDCLDAHKKEDLTQSHMERNHQKLRLYLSQTQINRLFYLSKDFSSDNFINFCESLSTIPEVYFLPEISHLVELNSTRIYPVWPFVCGYLNFQKEEYRVQPYYEILNILHRLLKQPSLQTHHSEFIAMIQDILQWLSTDPKVDSLFVGTIMKVINQCKQNILKSVWQAIFKAFRDALTHIRLDFALNLRNLENKALYQDYVISETIAGEDILFIRQNIQLYKQKPHLIEPHFKNFKNKDTIRCFILPVFQNFIIDHLELFPPSTELYELLRNTISSLKTEQLEKIYGYILNQLKNVDVDLVQLTVCLLSTPISHKIIQTLGKIIETCQTQFPELNQPVKLGIEDKITELQNFKLNYNGIVKKTVLDLVILKSIQQMMTNFNSQTLGALAQMVSTAVKTSRQFNRNITLRYLLWKDGLLKDLKQLPGLIKKQRNAESLMLSILSRQVLLSQSWENYVQYFSSLLSDLCNRFAEYLKYLKYYRSCNKDDLNFYYFNQIQREVSDYKKIMAKVISELLSVDWSKVKKDTKINFIKTITLCLKVGYFKATAQGFAFEITQQQQILSQISDNIAEKI